jgi:hypothetical protein
MRQYDGARDVSMGLIAPGASVRPRFRRPAESLASHFPIRCFTCYCRRRYLLLQEEVPARSRKHSVALYIHRQHWTYFPTVFQLPSKCTAPSTALRLGEACRSAWTGVIDSAAAPKRARENPHCEAGAPQHVEASTVWIPHFSTAANNRQPLEACSAGRGMQQ